MRLASSEPLAAPLVDPNYLAEEHDIATLLTGLRLARRIGEANAVDGWRVAEAQPGAGEIREDYLRASLLAYFHYAGTCAIGSAVDPELRVYGIDGLRVADASVMPSLVSANTNATGVRDRRACRRPARVNLRPAGPSYAV